MKGETRMLENRKPWKGNSCLVYRRCSKDEQDASIDDQEIHIRANRRDFGLDRLLGGFEDDGRRGHDETRPGLKALLAYVKAHPNPVRNNSDFIPILVYDLARFGRFDDAKKIFAYFVEIERYGYEFYSVTEKIRSRGNIADFVQAIVKSEQAYDYSVKLSNYGLRTGCSLAEKGWWPGGSAPYGYDRMTYGSDGNPKYRYTTLPDKTVEKRTPDGTLVESIPPIKDRGRIRSAYSDKIKTDKVKLVPADPEKVKVVGLIFEKFVKDGWGLKRIASWLNAQGFRPPRGRHWLHTTVRSLLGNVAYKGWLVYGRRSDGKHHWLTIQKTENGYAPVIERKDVPGRTFVYREIDECIVDEENHEALVEAAVWDKAQEILESQKHGEKPGLGVKSKHLLTGDGLMKCVHCGYRFQGDTDRRSQVRRYIDSGYHMGGKEVCSFTMVPAEPLERWIVDQIQARILDGRAALFASREELEEAIEQALLAGRDAAPPKDDEIKDLERKIAERKDKVAMVFSNIAPENLPLLNDHLGRLRQEIEALEGELRALRVATRAENIVTRDLKALAREAAGYLVNLREVLEEGSPDEKKRFIRAFVGEIVVDGKKREVRVGFFADQDGAPLGPLLRLVEEATGTECPLVQGPLGA
jgi:DNA invertase Pin-like site-specific DNA recombinase